MVFEKKNGGKLLEFVSTLIKDHPRKVCRQIKFYSILQVKPVSDEYF